MKSVLELLKSPLFHTSLIVGIISSIPRWEFLRVLKAKEEKKPTEKRGKSSVGSALHALEAKTMEILQGKNTLTIITIIT